ncbi:O-antigen ligase family protein [Algoriphagus mannitolivorans]|uniref:O-antigen ligase family protein n=1 Tax=Algoriphagus mannitolivorans TaxID=226504 RepID=UPI00040D8035|nr:O-antigen ligase family protein [Algoriphagus mannitolivorans]
MEIFLSSIKKQKLSFFWFCVHAVLGISAAFTPYPMILFFYVALGYSFINLFWIHSRQRPRLIAEIIIYFASFEALGRLAGSDPFLPYELGKYILLFLCPLGLILSRNYSWKGIIGLVVLLLSIPAVIFDESGLVTFNDLKFNLLGLLNIGVAIWFFSSLNISLKHLINWSKLIVLPIISVLILTIIRTPDLDEVEFSLGANFATAGGFGSNQVSTILGLGVFIMAICWLLNYRVTGFKSLDLVILCLFTGQGLLTFSRGGMIGAFIAIVVVMYYLGKLSQQERHRLGIPNFKKYILPVTIVLIVVMSVANMVTGGMLLLRYMGETQGTLSGSAEKNLNKITTNRSDIFLEDVDLFLEYPMLGVGVGASTYLRQEYKNYAPHVELSRLIAEHGFLGIVIFSLFILIYFLNRNQAPDTISKGLLIAFYFLGFLATFHSATRTYITPLLMGVSCVVIGQSSKKSNKPRPHSDPSKLVLAQKPLKQL